MKCSWNIQEWSDRSNINRTHRVYSDKQSSHDTIKTFLCQRSNSYSLLIMELPPQSNKSGHSFQISLLLTVRTTTKWCKSYSRIPLLRSHVCKNAERMISKPPKHFFLALSCCCSLLLVQDTTKWEITWLFHFKGSMYKLTETRAPVDNALLEFLGFLWPSRATKFPTKVQDDWARPNIWDIHRES